MQFKLNINDDKAMLVSKDSQENALKDSAERQSRKSKRTVKKTKKAMSLESEDFENSINSEPREGNIIEEHIGLEESQGSNNADIVMEGSLLYRYELDQIELEGCWSISNDITRERFSYLLLKNKEKNLICPLKSQEIDLNNFINLDEEVKKYFNQPKDEYNLHVCSANLFECLLIPHSDVFNTVLNLLTGEYHGFFLYYNKTIEDRFYLSFSLEDNQVRISGEGTNSLGNFNILGFINLYTTREELMYKNSTESDIINLGEFKLTRIYNAFNPNENYRVIKSYQHRKKKGFDYSDSNSLI